MRRKTTNLLAGAMALVLIACGATEDLEASRAEVGRFHRDLNASRFVEIYRNSSPLMRAQSPEDEFVTFLGAVRTKLGKVTDTQSRGWNVNYAPGGSRATLAYETTFERGAADETFVFDLSTEPAKLVGYNIASRALIVN